MFCLGTAWSCSDRRVFYGRLQLADQRPGAAQARHGSVFTQDGKTIIVQFDAERALALYAIRDGKLVETGERIKLAAEPVSIPSMPR